MYEKMNFSTPYSKFLWKKTHSFKSCDDLKLVHFTHKYIGNECF